MKIEEHIIALSVLAWNHRQDQAELNSQADDATVLL